jgi:transcriptional regulator with GAF, ATPase, and Fis domain
VGREANVKAGTSVLRVRALLHDLIAEVNSLDKEFSRIRKAQPLEECCGITIDLNMEVQRFETALIRGALSWTKGNQTDAARLLSLKVTTLNLKIKRYNIVCSDYR